MKKLINLLLSVLLTVGFFIEPTYAQQNIHNGYQFTDEIRLETTSVKDQNKSGTCWCFATVSFIETELLRMGKTVYDLSEMYLVHHTYMQKARDFVKFHGHNNFGQGGQAHDAMIELAQHGIVPEKVYPGTSYGSEKHEHSELASVLEEHVKSITKKNGKLTPVWDEGYNKLLDNYFGEVPETFNYKNETYTPKSFLKETGIDPYNYVELSSFTHHPWYQTFDLEDNKYYLTKNSWNSDNNGYGGFLYMSETYIRLNTIAIMLHKEAIPNDIAEKLGL